jgi:hypothetical protein
MTAKMIRREPEIVLLLPQNFYLQMEIVDRTGKERSPVWET